MGEKPRDVAAVGAEILQYFLRHPDAADTLEGITRWRLTEERIYRYSDETEDALKWLVSLGLLVEHHSPATGHLYSFNREKLAEAENFVHEGRPERGEDKK